MKLGKLALAAMLVAAPLMAAGAAAAQTAAPAAAAPQPAPGTLGAPGVSTGPAANDPNKAVFPDPTHIPFILPDNIPWTGQVGKEQQYNVMGDPRKPGPYIMLLKWWPGSYSKPHFHGKPRYITVISGTWWVSSSNHYDPTKTYPLHAGTVVQDIVNTAHWDGAKDEPVVLEIVGEGPVPNVNVGEDGKPLGANNF